MRLLCVDTSTFFESVALTDGLEIRAERYVERRRGHATGILDDVVSLLEETGWQMDDVDGYACGLGPGGFTGLRIGLSTAKGFALSLGRPLFGARSTQLSCSVRKRHRIPLLSSTLDAMNLYRRGSTVCADLPPTKCIERRARPIQALALRGRRRATISRGPGIHLSSMRD